MNSDEKRGGGGPERTRAARLVASMAAIIAGVLAGATAASMGQLTERPLAGALAHPAIGYYTRPTDDLVAELGRHIEDGDVRVSFDEGTGYLRSVLDALHVPVESQMLVMSKTGVQALYTGPANPRAIFFNDAVTVGYIRGAPLLELAVHDPQQGVLFYALEQKAQPHPIFERRPACLSCHQNYSTLHVPGMLARSVFMAPDGLPLSQFGSYDADDRTPFRRRWGGWYVTGTHGAMRHIGNAVVTDKEKRETIVSDSTLHRISLEAVFDDTRGYVSTHSDIAALMVFEHQGHMTNLITRLGWEARIAAYDHRGDLAGAPLRDAVNELVDYLLFVDEEPLTATITGTAGFAEKFAAQGPADRRGRSLRQLDLERRLLRYPCSYMIYSAAFGALPVDVRGAIYGRMWDVLSGRETSPRYARLSEADRRAVVEILRETLHDLPDDFRATDAAATDSLRPKALQVLRTAVEEQERWIKVHAAEALLSLDYPQGVGRAFEIELASNGGEPQYRIGIWRVLAQAAGGNQQREQWISKILAAFLDTRGPDRLHAAETLAKLGYRTAEREAGAFELVAATGHGPLAANARWILANSGRGRDGILLAELLDSDDAGTRGDAAYAIRHLRKLSPAAWEKLAAAARNEPAGSHARVSLMSAAFVHAPSDQKAYFKVELLKYAHAGTNEEKYEVCAALAQAGHDDDLPLLSGLLNHADPDVRVGAAHAILRIGPR